MNDIDTRNDNEREYNVIALVIRVIGRIMLGAGIILAIIVFFSDQMYSLILGSVVLAIFTAFSLSLFGIAEMIDLLENINKNIKNKC